MTETPACKINGNNISESLKHFKGEKKTLKSLHFTSTIAIMLFFVSTN